MSQKSTVRIFFRLVAPISVLTLFIYLFACRKFHIFESSWKAWIKIHLFHVSGIWNWSCEYLPVCTAAASSIPLFPFFSLQPFRFFGCFSSKVHVFCAVGIWWSFFPVNTGYLYWASQPGTRYWWLRRQVQTKARTSGRNHPAETAVWCCSPLLRAPDLPSNCLSIRFVRCSQSNCKTNSSALWFIVTTSLCQDWVIYAPAAFLGCGSHLSGSLSEIEPKFFVTRYCHGSPIHYHRKLIGQKLERHIAT